MFLEYAGRVKNMLIFMTKRKKKKMKITEIIPDNLPRWAIKAMAAGKFFHVALDKIKVNRGQGVRVIHCLQCGKKTRINPNNRYYTCGTKCTDREKRARGIKRV